MLELRSKPPFLTFLERKVNQRTFPRIHHFILAELLGFQRTFHEKSFVSGFGADAPTFNATHKKHVTSRAFLYYTAVSILSAFEFLASYIFSDKKAYFKLTEKP